MARSGVHLGEWGWGWGEDGREVWSDMALLFHHFVKFIDTFLIWQAVLLNTWEKLNTHAFILIN